MNPDGVPGESSICGNKREGEESKQTINVDRPSRKNSEKDDGEHTEEKQFGEEASL